MPIRLWLMQCCNIGCFAGRLDPRLKSATQQQRRIRCHMALFQYNLVAFIRSSCLNHSVCKETIGQTQTRKRIYCGRWATQLSLECIGGAVLGLLFTTIQSFKVLSVSKRHDNYMLPREVIGYLSPRKNSSHSTHDVCPMVARPHRQTPWLSPTTSDPAGLLTYNPHDTAKMPF